jgi:hyaluronoglucosaminidase
MEPFAIRGVIEGFYGPPWSLEERLDMVSFLGRHHFTSYFLAPKDDPFLRERWMDPHPPEQLQELEQLQRHAVREGIAFFYCLSPGLSMQYSSEEHFQRLKAKYRSMFDLGVRHFGLLFDDIPMQLMHVEDVSSFPTLADAHAEVTLRLWQNLQAWSPETRLVVCPALYNGTGNEPYIVRLGQRLPQEILLFWTGRLVCSPYLTERDAAHFQEMTGHRALYWDNYPVNDLGMRNELHIGPLLHRDPGLFRHASGYVANAMELAESSKIPLITAAHYLRDPLGYQPEEAWRKAMEEVAGPDAPILHAFADNVRSSFLHDVESPALTEELHRFRFHYLYGDKQQAIMELEQFFRQMEKGAQHLLHGMANRKLAREIRPWVLKYWHWAKVGRAAVKLIEENSRGRKARTVVQYVSLRKWLKRTERLPQKVCGPVMKLFVDAILREGQKSRE